MPSGDVAGRDGQLSHGDHAATGHQRHRPLRLRIEFANRFDLVSEELDADGSRIRGREDVDDAAPRGVFPRRAHGIFPDIAHLVQGPGQVIRGEEPSDLQVETLAHEGLG